YVFFFSSRRRHTRFSRDWSSDVCSSDLRVGRFHAKDDGVVVGRLHGLNGRVVQLVGVARGRVQRSLELGLHVRGREGPPVVEQDAPAQAEDVFRRVGGHGPRFGQGRHDLAFGRDLDQAFQYIVVDDGRRRGGGGGRRIQPRRLGRLDHHQVPAPHGGGRGLGEGGQAQQHQQRDDGWRRPTDRCRAQRTFLP